MKYAIFQDTRAGKRPYNEDRLGCWQREGSLLVGEAGATMREIVGAVKQVTEIIGTIAVASQEQSGGIDQVNQAMSQIDGVTQQNAALVEEAAAAAASLQDQASQLISAVVAFKIDDDRAEPSPEATAEVSPASVRPDQRPAPRRTRLTGPG